MTESYWKMRLAIVKLGSILLILNCIPIVITLRYEKPVAEKLWRQRCVRNALVLNDCNWCWCNTNFRYTCNARVCGEVDMFGHFNDAIQEINVGMEGHGVWRSTENACEPGVHYTRRNLLCVCTEDGTWPSPVCRDTFRVLHNVEVMDNFKISSSQKCSPMKLYLADCNVCFCPSTGYVDPSLCTKNKCTREDVQAISTKSENDDMIEEIYAQCDLNKKYQLGCKSCICLRNNRLLCDNCTEDSYCAGRNPGENFNIDCNTCHCDDKGMIFCTTKECLGGHEDVEPLKDTSLFRSSSRPIEDIDCTPGTRYKKDCNTCYCFRTRGNTKKFGCSLKICNTDSEQHCEIGKTYRKGCLECHCHYFNGRMIEICETIPRCQDLMSLRLQYPVQECEPMQVYTKGCNSCQCLPDGKTVTCTDHSCDNKAISLDVIPVAQSFPDCPKGHSYKIDCNYCFCLENGNALCTTIKCNNTK